MKTETMTCPSCEGTGIRLTPPKPRGRRRKVDLAELARLMEGGLNAIEAADAMGCSRATVYDTIKREGLALFGRRKKVAKG